MMGILDLQKQTRELGRIRIGDQVAIPGKAGRTRPSKLTAFRFTTNSEPGARAVAELYGGTMRPWVPVEGGKATQAFEVYTDATVLPVMVPPGEAAVSQWWELWTGGGCQRRCDGFTEQLKQEACSCPVAGPLRTAAAQQGRACKPTTRVNVILPDLPDLGVWRYESHGYYAAVEMAGTAELLGQARAAGQIIPAVLRIEPREVIRADAEGRPQTRQFPVVVLELGATLRELVGDTTPGSLADALPPAPGVLELEAPKTPAPANPRAGAGPAVDAGGTGKGKPVTPASTPSSPQEVADAARQETSAARLTALATLTRDNGWVDETVEDADGIGEPLWGLLTALRDQLMGAVS